MHSGISIHRIVGGSLGAEENGGSSNGMRNPRRQFPGVRKIWHCTYLVLDLVLQRLDLILKFLWSVPGTDSPFFFLMSTKTLSHVLLPAKAQ